MNCRRKFLGAVGAWLTGLATGTRAQAPKSSPVKELARHPLTGPHAGMEATLVEVTLTPGAPSTGHRHPGFILGYVLDGEMRFGINGEAQHIVKAGSTFFEPIGALHSTGGSAKADAPVRFLAFSVAPKGSPLTLPA